MSLLLKFAVSSKKYSLSNYFRKKRFTLFMKMIEEIGKKPVKILDVGGTVNFWENMGVAGGSEFEITIINIIKEESIYDNIKCIKGDARDMNYISDLEFDIVFSNSTIEHVGDYEDQNKMAKEVKRN